MLTVSRTVIGLLLALALSGCTSAHKAMMQAARNAPAANVRIGPQIEVFNNAVAQVKAVLGPDGSAHVLVDQIKPRQLLYIVVDREGGIRRSEVLKSGFCSHFDIALDRDESLQVIADEQHLVLANDKWQASPLAVPFKGSGLTFAKSGGRSSGIVLIVRGKEAGAERRWDVGILAGGGYGAGFILPIPLYYFPDKIAAAHESPAGSWNWTVLDPDTNKDVQGFSVAADDQGAIHVLYKGGGIWSKDLVYARIVPSSADDASRHGQGTEFGTKGAQQEPAKVSGQEITGNTNYYAFAVEPESGAALIASVEGYPLKWSSRIVRNGIIGTTGATFYGGYLLCLAPAGRETFHALSIGAPTDASVFKLKLPVYYLSYRNGTWTAPVGLHAAAYLDTGTWAPTPMALASDGSGNAFAIWATSDGKVVARWLQLEGDGQKY